MRNSLKAESLHDCVSRMRTLLRETGRKGSLRDPMGSVCEDTGYTETQIHTIFWTGVDGPLTMGELATRVGISDKTLTGIVDRLERDEMLVRVRDPDDRRVVRVRLSTKGHVTYVKIEKLMEGTMKRALSTLDARERSCFVDLIEKMLVGLSAQYARVSLHVSKGTAK